MPNGQRSRRTSALYRLRGNSLNAVYLRGSPAACRALGHKLVVFRYTEHEVLCVLIWLCFGNYSRLDGTTAPVFRIFEKPTGHSALQSGESASIGRRIGTRPN